MIPDETIARVRDSVNLVELVRESVPGLKKAGRNFRARCPFHQERTPSFNVNPEMGLFKCFGCGVGGDVFKFIMLTEGLNYPEAIKKMAGRVGIAIEEQKSEALTVEAKEREVLYNLLEDAARFYHRHLLESPDAAEARAYLEKRGLTQESLVKFSIGYAPASGNALRDAASRKGWNTEILEKAGLLRRKEGSGRIYDHLWNRIVFPIWDAQGRIIAFGGRAMGDAMPKYINSPETPVYSKSRHLYGLFQGAPTLRKRRHMIILEGYMDVVVCHQYGFDYSSATLGTALTEEHVRLLRRYSDRVTLLFDPDNAGAQATLRGGELLIADGFTVDVVTLPDGLDPDEILVLSGTERLEHFLKHAVPFMDYYFAQAMKRHPGLSPETKLVIAKEVLPLIRQMRDPLLQDEYLGKLAEALHAEKNILAQQMKRLKGERAPEAVAGVPTKTAMTEQKIVISMEEEIVLTALHHPSQQVVTLLDSLEWREERCREAWGVLRTQIGSGTLHLAEALPELSEEVREWLTRLALLERNHRQPMSVLQELVVSWRRQLEKIALHEMEAEIQSMTEGKIPHDSQKEQVYKDLLRRLKGSQTVSH